MAKQKHPPCPLPGIGPDDGAGRYTHWPLRQRHLPPPKGKLSTGYPQDTIATPPEVEPEVIPISEEPTTTIGDT